jgi:hypothetical protein
VTVLLQAVKKSKNSEELPSQTKVEDATTGTNVQQSANSTQYDLVNTVECASGSDIASVPQHATTQSDLNQDQVGDIE